MYIQFNEYWYKRGYIENANYIYKVEKLENGKWGITHLEYGFVVDMPLGEGELEQGKVLVTEEIRSMLTKAKMADEYRISCAIKNRKNGYSEIPLDMVKYGENPSCCEPLLARIERKELRAELENIIDMLTVKQQKIIRLRYLEDYSTSATAEIMGVHISAITHTEKRALKKMREIFIKRQLII